MTKSAATARTPYFPTLLAPSPEFDTIASTPVPTTALVDILSYRRDGDSDGEQVVIDRYIKPLDPTVDAYGNLFVTIGEGTPNVAFTAHTDTVHGYQESLKSTTQTLVLTDAGRMVETTDGGCLGADDGTGVWILLNLIRAGIPGLYCFFRDEEIGRAGSEFSLKNCPERYTSIDIMVSFDRAGTTDIITHQMGERCCSEDFANALADAVGNKQLAPDPTGSFTDSATFVGVIPECTNMSVGYDAQHTSAESQDLTFVTWLVNRLIQVDWAQLPVVREPGVDSDSDISLEDASLVAATLPTELVTMLRDYYRIEPEELVEDLADYLGYTIGDIMTTASYLDMLDSREEWT